ncbi:MAG: hypothetical protein C0606_06770 [Hyphomicrobiales bacterium]|nr:MAG: hypothetical protein C0606_06770 [Hyphomicrobiales bacterium]
MDGYDSTKAEPNLLWLFTGITGRITRMPFWLGIAFVNVIVAFFVGTPMRNPALAPTFAPFMPFILIPAIWAEIALIIKRAHDCNVTGFVALLSLIPFLNVLLVVFFGVQPGDPKPNAFGRGRNSPV